MSASAVFTRRSLVLKNDIGAGDLNQRYVGGEYNVLVVNASREMAKEMTVELTLNIPGCSISYAPTLELARLILRRRSIQLIVASPLLPDGNIATLKDVLQRIATPPDIVVVTNGRGQQPMMLGDPRYACTDLRTLVAQRTPHKPRPIILRPPARRQMTRSASAAARRNPAIENLGADIRNDLNNPLQEIVAMVFVAQAGHSGAASPLTLQALEAIERSAKAMSAVVNGLEAKIRDVVEKPV